MNRILLVDDEPEVINAITNHLQRDAHQVMTVANGRQALAAAIRHDPDLVIIDLELSNSGGMNLLRQLRAETKTRHIPVIMLTGRSLAGDRIAGFETGADDCVNKPFNPRELSLRIHAILRRTQKVIAMHDVRIGPYHLDRKNIVLYVGTQTLELTLTEYKLVAQFLDNPNVLHTRGELLTEVWGYNDGANTRTLDTHIRRLRDKLGALGNNIKTVRGVGYQLNVAAAA